MTKPKNPNIKTREIVGRSGRYVFTTYWDGFLQRYVCDIIMPDNKVHKKWVISKRRGVVDRQVQEMEEHL